MRALAVLASAMVTGCSCGLDGWPWGKGDTDTAVDGSSVYDECVGEVGAEASTEEVDLNADTWIDCPGNQLTVIGSADELVYVWPEDTGLVVPEVDFTTQQLVCFSHRNGCSGSAWITDIARSAKEPGTLVARIHEVEDCGDVCDCPGGAEAQLWITPKAEIRDCRYGRSCG